MIFFLGIGVGAADQFIVEVVDEPRIQLLEPGVRSPNAIEHLNKPVIDVREARAVEHFAEGRPVRLQISRAADWAELDRKKVHIVLLPHEHDRAAITARNLDIAGKLV